MLSKDKKTVFFISPFSDFQFVAIDAGKIQTLWWLNKEERFMQIRHVSIKNFRGIQKMGWISFSNYMLGWCWYFTKSTILDAIEYALSPKWNLTFEDCDFYSENTDVPIEIIVTVGQIPDELLKQEKFGLEQRGWNEKDGLHDEPQENDEFVLSIRLLVDKSRTSMDCNQ